MAVLLGGIDLGTIPIQLTRDIYYLSDNLDTFTVDYWPPHESYIINSLVQGTYSFTVAATPTTTFPILANSIEARAYLYDFYFRIHSTIQKLVLGNVLSEQTFSIEIWNAFFTNSTLTAIVNDGLDDVNLSLPVTLPQVFKPLQSFIGTVTAAATGIPTIDGFYLLTFDTQSVYVYVTGQRVLLWPFAPQTSFTETRQWLTDVIPSRLGEQRFALREIPRLTLAYEYKFQTKDEYSLAKSMAQDLAHLALATPLWSDVFKLSNLTIGQININFKTANLEFAANDVIVFWESYKVYEIREIASVSSTGIVLKLALTANHANCWAIPVRIGYTSSGINLNRSENNKISANIDFNIVNSYNSAVWPFTATFSSLPVLDFKSIVTGGLSERFSRDVSILDTETGSFIPLDNESYTRQRQIINISAETQAELFTIRRQFDYLQGKFNTFWLPSFNNDIVPFSTTLTSGVSTIKVIANNFTLYTQPVIRIIGDSVAYFTISGASDNGDGTENINFTTSVVTTINNITSIQYMSKVRLDTDSIEFLHDFTNSRTPRIAVKAAVLEVLA